MINKEQVYGDFYGKVSGYVRARIGNKHDAEDVISTVFMKVYQKLDSYDESRAALSTWIYAITKNAVADYFASRKNAPLPFDDAIEYERADEGEDYDELVQNLALYIDKLPQIQQDVIILRYYFKLGHKEIAKKIGMSYANTRKICSLAVAALREMMNEKLSG